jgi:DNA-binding transcriptional ArsR family regulator
MEQRTGSPTTKLVLLKLADNANEWVAWPSVQYIVDDTELSERAVREHLRKLETLGLVRAEKRFVDGVQTTTKYHLLADGWVPRKAGERIPRKKDKGASGAPVGHEVPKLHKMQGEGAESAPPVGHEAPPNPYVEPLLEPLLSASESSPSAKSKEEPSAAWSEFWTACTSWPGASDQPTAR